MIVREARASTAVRVGVTGVVQGVGFRPFVHRLALRHDLAGWIRNEAGGVEILLEGTPDGVRRCLDDLRSGAPPLARLDRVETASERPAGLASFVVRESTDDPDRRQPVSPDVSACDACLAEIEDPDDRRFGYPFNTCTDCGPRYTIIEAMPYDRERTSMRAFDLCPSCRAEYGRPGDRRYRSETNSCPACGPRLWTEEAGPSASEPEGDRQAALRAAARALRAGEVVAIRGLGGFHLAVDATSETAVRRLRRRKRRPAKPLAVMVGDLPAARKVVVVDADGERLLTAPERPIVLLRRRPGAPLA
ncbi:MAG: acylphosphatase, partial [Gemmatimonadota bacterium]